MLKIYILVKNSIAVLEECINYYCHWHFYITVFNFKVAMLTSYNVGSKW
jgi:hypothetical protein